MLRRRNILWFVVALSTVVATRNAGWAQSEERPPVHAVASPRPSVAPSVAPSPGASAEPSPTPPPPPYNRLVWRSIGPAISGGRVAAVVGSARDPKLYYVGAAGGGVWKSDDGAATWNPVFDKTRIASIGAIAIDPNNDDVVWVGTGESNPRNDVIAGAGIYRTTDGGKNWTYMGLRETKYISSIAIDPHDSNRVVVGALGDVFADSPDRGVYRTTDGGKTWQKTLYLTPSSGVSDLKVDPKNFAVQYAGMWHFRRLPWTFTSGGTDDGLFKSTDGGATWTQLTGHGLPTGLTGRVGLAVAPSDPRRVYALIESKDGILWRSDDAGATWALVSKNTLVDQRPFYFSHVDVDPSDPDHVYGVSEMLSESKDGGKTFKAIADDVHVDYHAMWIAPNDPKRAIVGEDGGYALTLDGGDDWSFSENLPIGEVYHTGYDDETPYRLCDALQDNDAFCGPSNSLDPNGTPNRDWNDVVGGDGVWVWPDPTDPNLVWADSEDGYLTVYDRRAKTASNVSPWIGTSAASFDISRARYRFNWDSPIAFAPWDPHTVWFGGDVVFQTTDRGQTWRAISPDLTLNDKAHQQPSGGPLAFDVSGAEYTDTILDIEGSRFGRGEIWVGTDDGLVQLTRDGGAHWKNVTPPNLQPYGRFEIVAPSTLVAGTAYAVYDRHYLGDNSPYAFVTRDFGAHWTSIAHGLPPDQPLRSIRPDTRNRNVVYLGSEQAVHISYDGGATWRSFALNMPGVPVFDLRIQPRYNDLIAATHGRALYVFDDLAPVQELGAAQAARAMFFAPRPAYEFQLHSDIGTYTKYFAKNPPRGAILSFYQATPGTSPPPVRIYDAQHRLIRTIAGVHCVAKKPEPFVTNDTGLNRTTWDLRTDGPVRWNGAAREAYKGPRTGPYVLPGRYTVSMQIDGRLLSEPVDVHADPRQAYTPAQRAARYAYAVAATAKFSAVDAALNRLDAVIASATTAAAAAGSNAALSATLNRTIARARDIRGELTADYHNDEDSIQMPGKLREDIESLDASGLGGPPTQAERSLAARVGAEYAPRHARRQRLLCERRARGERRTRRGPRLPAVRIAAGSQARLRNGRGGLDVRLSGGRRSGRIIVCPSVHGFMELLGDDPRSARPRSTKHHFELGHRADGRQQELDRRSLGTSRRARGNRLRRLRSAAARLDLRGFPRRRKLRALDLERATQRHLGVVRHVLYAACAAVGRPASVDRP